MKNLVCALGVLSLFSLSWVTSGLANSGGGGDDSYRPLTLPGGSYTCRYYSMEEVLNEAGDNIVWSEPVQVGDTQELTPGSFVNFAGQGHLFSAELDEANRLTISLFFGDVLESVAQGVSASRVSLERLAELGREVVCTKSRIYLERIQRPVIDLDRIEELLRGLDKPGYRHRMMSTTEQVRKSPYLRPDLLEENRRMRMILKTMLGVSPFLGLLSSEETETESVEEDSSSTSE